MTIAWKTLIATQAAVSLVAVTMWVETPTRLIWNATASVPTGLYSVRPVDDLSVGELVAVMPPEPLASFLADGGYLPRNVPLLKHVGGLPGQTVCRSEARILVDEVMVGGARTNDRRGRPLPAWVGCRRLADGEVFLMNPDSPDSLDGRYFGPLPSQSIIGRAAPVWTNRGA